MEEGRSYLKPRWWRKVRRAYEELREETSNFTTKKRIRVQDIQTNRFKLIALRLVSGLDRQQVATHLTCDVQDLVSWEEGTAKKGIDYDKANKLRLLVGFATMGRSSTTNPFVTRFFDECSLSDMKKDRTTGRKLTIALQVTVTLLFGFLILGFVSNVLGILEALETMMSIVFTVTLVPFLVGVALLFVFGSMNPLLKGSIGEELCYAKRFLLSRNSRVTKWAKVLLFNAARSIDDRAREISEPEDVDELYGEIAKSVRSKLVPHAEDFENLGERKKAVFINTVRTLAEHFFSPSLESTSSLQMIFPDLNLEFPEGLPEVRKERRVAESIERLDRRLYYENPTGRIVVDSVIILCAAFDITFLSWIPMNLDVTAAVALFVAVSFVVASLRVAHLKGG